MSVRVLKYGGVRFLENGDVVDEVSRQAHQAYNQLVAQKRRQTANYQKLRSEAVPGLDEAEQRYLQLTEEKRALEAYIKSERKKETAKTRRVDPDSGTTVRKIRAVAHEEAERVTEIKAEMKKLSPVLKEMRDKFKALTIPAYEEFKRRKALFVGESPSPKRQKLANETILAEMMDEDWPDVWKEQMRAEAEGREEKNAMHRDEFFYQAATRNQIDEDLNRASKTSFNMPMFRSLKRAQMGKKVGVQCTMDGVTLGEISGQMKGGLAILTQRRYRPNSQGNRARSMVATMRMKIQKKGAPTPQTVTFDVVLHRPIPEDARIKFAWLVPSRHKGRLSYTLQLVVDLPRPMKERAPGKGTAHVRLIWEKENEEQYAFAEVNGERLLTPVSPAGKSIVSGQQMTEGLHAVMDRLFNVARENLKQRIEDGDVPDWVPEECRYIANWRRPEKLIEVLDRWVTEELGEKREQVWDKWKNHRLAAGEDLHESLARITGDDVKLSGAGTPWQLWMVSYVQKHRHLSEWRENQRRKTLAWRKDYYRCVAAEMSTRFNKCVLEKVDIASQRRKPGVTAKGSGFEKSRALIQSVAPGEFKEALAHAFGERFSEKKEEDEKKAA